VAQTEALCRHLRRGTVENHDKIHWNSWSWGLNLNPGPLEYKVPVSTGYTQQ
jgi:hypothetical protein